MIYDVCVIGGGPAGMFSAYYSSSRGLKTVLLEADFKLGGRMQYYLDKAIYDLPGDFGITGEDYLTKLEVQLLKSPTIVRLNTLVQTVFEHPDYLKIQTNSGSLKSKTIIIATGNGYLSTKKITDNRFSIEAINYIDYDVPKLLPHQNKKLAIIGHTPTAADWAIHAKKAGYSVWFYAYKPLTLQPMLLDSLANLQIPILLWSDIKLLKKIKNQLSIDTIHFDHVYAHIGTIKTTVDYPVRIQQLDNGTTTNSRFFIAGDARNENGKIKLLLGAMHDAMQAVNEATQFLKPTEHYQPIVSTHHSIFKEWEV